MTVRDLMADEVTRVATRPRRRTRAWLLLFLGVAATLVVLKWRSIRNDPIQILVRAAPRKTRPFQARLSGGFHWAPVRFTRGAEKPVDDDSATVLAAAAEIVHRNESDSSPHVRHALAVAHILTGDPRKAAEALESLAAGQEDSRVWTDLAAAQYDAALRGDDPSRLAKALVAADAALRIDPKLPEARFNRALTIEALGLRDLARMEWESYLRLDSGSEWSAEAREHIRELQPEEDFLDVLKREYDHLAADPAAAHAFARKYPQRCRTWGEAEIIGDWARAAAAGNDALAAKHLRVARELGAELARDGGNQTLSAQVEAIDRATPAQRAILVQGYLHFSDALRVFRDRNATEARRLLTPAAAEFAQAGSPAELRARYYRANTLFDQGMIQEAGQEMERLLASAPPQFSAHRADLLWVTASVAFSEGRWGTCIDRWTEAASIFERLGELNFAATLRGHLAYTFDRLGDSARGWQNRMMALHELGRQLTSRQQEAIGSVVHAALMAEDLPAALSFLGLEIDVTSRIDKPLMRIDALLYRAELYRRMNDREAAVADLTEARRLLARTADPAYRASLGATASAVEASLASDPGVTVRLLSSVIEFHSTKGRRMFLPELLRQRGAAFQRMGDRDHAAADFEAGVAELERHRETLRSGEDRWGIFHAADELFSDAIALSLSRDDTQSAFDYAERARSRALFDTLGSPWHRVAPSDIPAGTAVVEYAVHKDATFIFVLDERGVHASRQPVERAKLVREIAAFNEAASSSDRAKFEQSGRSLHHFLISPVENLLLGKRTLAIVPDPTLSLMPFAALIDGSGRPLVETYALKIEPSAAFFTAAKRSSEMAAAKRALVVEGGEQLGRLSAAEREAEAVSHLYGRTVILRHDAATPESFLREAAGANVIHFAGHAVASTGGRDGYLLLTGHDSNNGRLDLKRIASMRLPRTSVVVLAACGTAEGEIRSTEGTISAARAFLAAGVPTVVATLWPIEDEASADFFPVLHQHLARGMAPAEALRATQIEWIRRGDHSTSLWASVQVIGN
jgi:CHAT domain-containing protein